MQGQLHVAQVNEARHWQQLVFHHYGRHILLPVPKQFALEREKRPCKLTSAHSCDYIYNGYAVQDHN
jgi:hypothetical protein